jgi:hypothetical protein
VATATAFLGAKYTLAFRAAAADRKGRCERACRGDRVRSRRFLHSCIGAAISSVALYALALGLGGNAYAEVIPAVCAQREIAVITLIEDHALVEDRTASKLSDAYVALLQARATCYDGRTADAVAEYDDILKSLGKIHIGRKQ